MLIFMGAGLGLGIAGTALALLNGGCGNGLNLFNNGCCGEGRYGGNMTECENEVVDLKAKVARLEAEMYTDEVGQQLYREIVSLSNREDDKIAANQKEVMSYIVDLSKEVALNKQANYYEGIILNNKIDCCCDKGAMRDEEIMSFVRCNYIPAMKKLSIDQICPQPMPLYNSWTAPKAETTTTA